MAEHEHDWIWVYGLGDGVAAKCPCGIHLSPEEVRHRLNAAEKLSAEDALTIPPSENMNGKERMAYHNLRDYAAAREAPDGR